MRPALSRETDLRERLGKIKNTEGAIDAYIEIVEEMKERMKVSAPYHKFLTIINPAS
jgi:tRNA-dihydrouridine synthase 1